jgi:hypothetical protein
MYTFPEGGLSILGLSGSQTETHAISSEVTFFGEFIHTKKNPNKFTPSIFVYLISKLDLSLSLSLSLASSWLVKNWGGGGVRKGVGGGGRNDPNIVCTYE